MGQLSAYIIILVVIFVVVGIIIAVGMVRSRNSGKGVSSTTAPMPDREQRNKQTRRDNTTDTSYNGSSPRNERERNRS